jgi:HK97 family phage portal protein
MSLFRNTENRSDPWEPLRSFDTAYGDGGSLNSNTSAALQLIPMFAATSLISDSLAILPCSAYRDKRKLDPQPMLCTNPHVNPIFTRAEWVHQFSTSYLLRGNAYGIITAIDATGFATKVAWLNPDGVTVDESGAMPVYYYGSKELDPGTLIHIPWYPQPGSIVGLSPVGYFKMQIETGSQAVKYGRNWFRGGSTPSGHLKYAAGTLTPEQSGYVKTRFKAAVANNDIFVSGKDWDWKALSVNPDEAQFLQTIKATANQIAAIYKVAPEDIGGEAGSSMTYATVEMNQLKFQTRALQPIFTRLEMHMNRLLPGKQYVKFNADALVRTDLLTRMQAHKIALDTGLETHAEGRAIEDRPPLSPAEQKAWEKYKETTKTTAAAAEPNNKGGAQNA